MPSLKAATWNCIWKLTVEKSCTNVTNVSMQPIEKKDWRFIKGHTLERNHINVTAVIFLGFHPKVFDVTWNFTWSDVFTIARAWPENDNRSRSKKLFFISHSAFSEEPYPSSIDQAREPPHTYSFGLFLLLKDLLIVSSLYAFLWFLKPYVFWRTTIWKRENIAKIVVWLWDSNAEAHLVH